MPISKIIENPVDMNHEIVEFGGEKYTLSGKPNASSIEQVLLMPDSKKQAFANHFSNLTGSEIEPESISKMMAVALTLEHEDEPNARYDISEIAKLSESNGLLFFALVAAAFKVLGLITENDSLHTPSVVEEIAAKNSPKGRGKSTSTSASPDTAPPASS